MLEIESTIRAYQEVLCSWEFTNPMGPPTFPEQFAWARFKKKFERPNRDRREQLRTECFERFSAVDEGLPTKIVLPNGEWYRAREKLHNWLSCEPVRRGDIDFPRGSSWHPTRGQNSIESYLSRGHWTCTPENFDEFSRLVYNHKALKRAFRRRYNRWFSEKKFDCSRRSADRLLYEKLGGTPKGAFQIFQWKLGQITKFVRGSRFSTVPKNNEMDRPINIEPFGNLLVQRQIGNYIRRTLKNKCTIDLDTLQDKHRVRIRENGVATIDLKDASDSMSLALCEFLLPKWLFKKLQDSRSFMLLGLDGEYHVPKKVSSMGNGFTFELMTIILLAICRTLDKNATVFGDDIIIKKSSALRLIRLLQEVGFVVNEDKSFLDGPFRESCGGNWHDSYGYVKSFDFRWPETIADCALTYNKVKYLSAIYPSFADLERALLAATPKSLRGGPLTDTCIRPSSWEDSVEDLPIYFACNTQGRTVSNKIAGGYKMRYQIKRVSSFVGFKWIPALASPKVYDLKHQWHWGKYEMYLFSGRVCDDIITGRGRWVKVRHYLMDGMVNTNPSALRDNDHSGASLTCISTVPDKDVNPHQDWRSHNLRVLSRSLAM